MKVSLIIPVKDGETTIGMCLNSISDLNFPKDEFELVVVDDGSTDQTPSIVKEFRINHPEIHTTILHAKKNLGAGNAINMGWKHAKGEFIAVTNADCVLDSEWLSEILKPFDDPKVGGVSGAVITPPKLSLLQRLIGYELEYRYSTYPDYILSPQDSGLAYRKKVLEEVDGYDPQFQTGYDVDIGYRVNQADYRVKYQPTARVFHYHRATIQEYFRQQMMTSKSRFQILVKHPKGIKGDNLANPTLMSLPLIILALAAGLIPSILYPTIRPVYYLGLLFYVGLITQYVARIFIKSPKSETLLLVPIMLLRSVALAGGIIQGAWLVISNRK